MTWFWKPKDFHHDETASALVCDKIRSLRIYCEVPRESYIGALVVDEDVLTQLKPSDTVMRAFCLQGYKVAMQNKQGETK